MRIRFHESFDVSAPPGPGGRAWVARDFSPWIAIPLFLFRPDGRTKMRLHRYPSPRFLDPHYSPP
jgi:hypothetical protein